MPTKQARNCRVGDILLFKNKLITRIDYNSHKRESYAVHTTDLANENPRLDAFDRVIYWGTQEAMF